MGNAIVDVSMCGLILISINVLLWIGDGSTDGVLGSPASFRQCVVSRIEIFPVLYIAARQNAPDIAMRI